MPDEPPVWAVALIYRYVILYNHILSKIYVYVMNLQNMQYMNRTKRSIQNQYVYDKTHKSISKVKDNY